MSDFMDRVVKLKERVLALKDEVNAIQDSYEAFIFDQDSKIQSQDDELTILKERVDELEGTGNNGERIKKIDPDGGTDR